MEENLKKFTRDNVVLDLDHLRRVVAHIIEVGAFVFDVEAQPGRGLISDSRGVPAVNDVTWIALATEGLSVVVPMGHPNGDVLLQKTYRRKDKHTGKFITYPNVYDEPPTQLFSWDVWEILTPLFFGNVIAIAHNAVFDVGSITKYYGGEIPTCPVVDTLTLQHLLNENLLLYGLKPLTERYYRVKYDHENVGKCIEAHPFYKVAHYAFMDARYTWLLYRRLRPLIDKAELNTVFELEMALIPVLVDMRLTGVAVDTEALISLQAALVERLTELETTVYRMANKKFNINSNAQLAEVLFSSKSAGGRGLKSSYYTPGGKKIKEQGGAIEWKHYSTDEKTLARFQGKDELIDVLAEYSEVNKLLTAFVLSFLGDPKDKRRPGCIYNGRIYPSFNQSGTVTGRFSSKEPNAQQWPRPGEDEKAFATQIRNLFVSDPGHLLVASDYDQVEVRLLAHYSGKGRLTQGILDGLDPHSATAAGLLGIPVDEFMARMAAGDKAIKAARQVAKGIAFAVVYGAGADKVASMAKITVGQAEEYLKMHRQLFPEVYTFKSKALRAARERQPAYIHTLISGRKRRLPELMSSDNKTKFRAERQAINSIIQGTSADITKMAMIKLHKMLDPDMKMILTVHDELVISCPEHKVEKCQEYMKDAMVGDWIKEYIPVIPITADSHTGRRLGECKG